MGGVGGAGGTERCCHVYDIMRVVMNFIVWTKEERGLLRSLGFLGGFVCVTIRDRWPRTNDVMMVVVKHQYDPLRAYWTCILRCSNSALPHLHLLKAQPTVMRLFSRCCTSPEQ